jgi:SspJ family small acid-soluble spore protein
MSRPAPRAILPRKKPVQERSARLVADILEAAARVLSREGARRFTTERVAAEAGVSIGSLYQYFPNKEALLFRLQTDEWNDTWDLLGEILDGGAGTPVERFRRAVLVFFRSEHEEAALRAALDDAGALFRDGPEAEAFRKKAFARAAPFFDQLLPEVAPAARAFAAELVLTSMGATAENVTARRLGRSAVDAWARAAADMYCAYFASLTAPAPPPPAAPRSPRRRAGGRPPASRAR